MKCSSTNNSSKSQTTLLLHSLPRDLPIPSHQRTGLHSIPNFHKEVSPPDQVLVFLPQNHTYSSTTMALLSSTKVLLKALINNTSLSTSTLEVHPFKTTREPTSTGNSIQALCSKGIIFPLAPLELPAKYVEDTILAIDCFHRMDYAFQGRNPPTQLAAMVAHSNSSCEEQQWLADSGVNTHITNRLDNLQIKQPFQPTEEVAVGNGSGLQIENTGSNLLHTSQFSFKLNNILHCPKASTNLLSIQKFCIDNCCYFILTSSHYYVKDLLTHATLLEGRSEHGLYPLRLGGNLHKNTKTFTAFLGIRTTSLVWHYRLGHPSLDIVNRVVKEKSLPVSNFDFNKSASCDSCQLGKSKRQPSHASNRISHQPLDLIHSDIWTSPMQSISGYKYYVIFVDDWSRFTWIYPLHHKSDVFANFVKFKLLVENQFSSKIK
jgi:hypothetical protein